MEQQRVIAYQMDLFQSLEQDAVCPSHNRDIVSGAEARKALQVEGAGEQGRALARNLMQVVCSPDNIKRAYKRVKQNKGVAGIDSYRIKQCKRTYTLQKFLVSLGVEKWQSWILALSGKGFWRLSGCPQVQQAMGTQWFDKQGLYNLSLNYVRLTNLKKPPSTRVRWVV